MESSSPRSELDEKHSENTDPAEAIETGQADVEAEKAEPDKGPSLGNYLVYFLYLFAMLMLTPIRGSFPTVPEMEALWPLFLASSVPWALEWYVKSE